ncbi:MAG TPA: GNAT family protein [Flavisolibacter sp.]|nr:GNAT family protein [Flavisolibacter sp.]
MIRLEHFTEADFQQLIHWINNEHLLMNWSGAMFRFPLTESSLKWYLEGANNTENPEVYIYKAVDTETGECIGHISLGGFSQKNKSARISRVLVGDTAARGKGYCTAMIKEVSRIGFEELGLHRISLGVYDFNKSAIRCYQKAGYSIEGVHRDILQYKEGEYWSLVEMSMLENEWKKLPEAIAHA